MVFWSGVLLCIASAGVQDSTFAAHFKWKRNLVALAPEGWAFFTRDPREAWPQVYSVQGEAGRPTLTRVRSSRLQNFFGIARDSRASEIELGSVIGQLAKDAWLPCQNGVSECLAKNPTSYYWFTHAGMGAPDWVQRLLYPILTSGWGVAALTWSVMALEVILFAALVMDRKWYPQILVAGICFHFGIVVVHGLVSFFFSVTGALILYLRPTDQLFPSLAALRSTVPTRLRAALPAGWQPQAAARESQAS